MKSFTLREKGFEAEFKRNQELLFRVTARRNRLFGLWAAVRWVCLPARRQRPMPRRSSRLTSKHLATPIGDT